MPCLWLFIMQIIIWRKICLRKLYIHITLHTRFLALPHTPVNKAHGITLQSLQTPKSIDASPWPLQRNLQRFFPPRVFYWDHVNSFMVRCGDRNSDGEGDWQRFNGPFHSSSNLFIQWVKLLDWSTWTSLEGFEILYSFRVECFSCKSGETKHCTHIHQHCSAKCRGGPLSNCRTYVSKQHEVEREKRSKH